MNARSQQFLAALRSGSRDARLQLFRDLPPSPFGDAAAGLLTSDAPAEQVMALGMLVTSYSFGQAADLGADLARAAYPFSLQVHDEQESSGPLDLMTVSAMAAAGMHALNLVGRYAESVAFGDEAIPQLEARRDDANLPDVFAHRIEALIGLHRIDEARTALADAGRRPKHSVHLGRLEGVLAGLLRRGTEVPSSAAPAVVSPEEFAAMDRFLRQGEALLTRSGTEMNQWRASGIHRQVGALLMDPVHGRDPERLGPAAEELQALEAWARASGHVDAQNDTLWEIYLCRSRMGQHSEAADALQVLRRNLEQRRAGIADPLERAGVATKYPYVYPALCQMLHRSRRTEELLGAMEAAKGRAVADVMAQRAGQLLDEAQFATPAARVAELLRPYRAHYLSFLVDDDDTLAVLVACDGSVHAAPPIPLGKDGLRRASRDADPRSWGKPDVADLMGPSVTGLDEALAPLVAWMEPLVRAGVLREGDHLCYSPDEHLHQVPLGYVRFGAGPLCRTFSVSRMHGARALTLLLAREPARPSEFVAAEVPSRQDLRNPEMVEHMRAPGKWLAGHLPGRILRDDAGTLAALRSQPLAGRVLHFATHGVFPEGGGLRGQNPFESSGVALAGDDGLPDLERLARGEADAELLTPRRALAERLDLGGSHVTFQSCLSGLAREGIGGDALGLDWACFQLGASSLLASHWNVSAELSAEFFVRFYRLWLEEGRTRAAAWRETVLGMMAQGGVLAEPYAWAAFSLGGDWR